MKLLHSIRRTHIIPGNQNSSLFDKLFKTGVIIKGVTAAIEFLAGLILILVPGSIQRFIEIITRRELIEDPNDTIANYIINAGHAFNSGSKWFGVLYLWSHALIKLIAVYGLLRSKLWAYPFSLVVIIGFIIYQLYSIALQATIGMILLTVFDVFIIWLICKEWQSVRNTRQHLSSKD